MPAGISQSTVNPAALTPPRAPQQRTQEPAAAADAQNAQAVLATGGQDLVRAPEPGAGNQRVDNQMETNPAETGRSEQTGAGSAPPPRQLQMDVNRGLGGNVDITA